MTDPGTAAALTIATKLQELRLQAGNPSSRALAEDLGGLASHTTINYTFRGRVPGWAVVRALVAALDGDEAEFKELWITAMKGGSRSTAAEVADLALKLKLKHLTERVTALEAAQKDCPHEA